MFRAERRRNLKHNLKVGLAKHGWSWRHLRKHLKARRNLSLSKRVAMANWYLENELGKRGISAR